MHLLKLQSEAGPEFMFDIVNQFFDASGKIVHQFNTTMLVIPFVTFLHLVFYFIENKNTKINFMILFLELHSN